MDVKKVRLGLMLSLILGSGVTVTPLVHANYCPSVCSCIGSSGLGGPCYDGLGGPAYDGLGIVLTKYSLQTPEHNHHSMASP